MAKRFFDTNTWAKRWFRELKPAEKTAWFYMLTNCDAVGVWDADTKQAEFCIGSEVDWENLKAASNGNIEVLDNGKWWLVDFCRYQYGVINDNSNSKVQKHFYSLLKNHGLWESYCATLEYVPDIRELSDSPSIEIYTRDKGTCQYCGAELPENSYEVDHIIPRTSGGKNAEENLALCCGDCNTKKGTKPLDVFLSKFGLEGTCSARVLQYWSTVQDKEKEKEKVKEEEKEYYADAVALTKAEYGKLVARVGEKVTKAAIEKLSAWKLAKGATYKSDYHAILTWVLGAVTGQKGGAIPVLKAAPVPGPPCPICGKECEKDFGYWKCEIHGRQESLE